MSATKIFTGDDYLVPEGTTHVIECTLVDETGAAIQIAAVLAATVSLHDVVTGTPINRIAQNVKNANGGAITDAGAGVAKFTMTFDPVDARIVDRSLAEEQHRATFSFTYFRGVGLENGGLTHRVLYRVANLEALDA